MAVHEQDANEMEREYGCKVCGHDSAQLPQLLVLSNAFTGASIPHSVSTPLSRQAAAIL